VEGVDNTEKYAPVVQLSTVRAILILTVREKLHTRLADFSNAFVQAKLKETFYVKLPWMYEATNGSDVLLKLNKLLYALVQAPLCWYMHLMEGY